MSALLAVGSSAIAHADVIQADYLYPDLASVFEADGTQNTPFTFSMLGGALTLSSGNNIITLTVNENNSFTPAAFNGPRLTDLTSSNVLNVLFDASSTIAGFNQADISFDTSHIWLNMQGLTFTTGQTAVVDIVSSGGGDTQVPEPITMSIFGAGLAGAVAMQRRRKKSA